MNPRLTEIYRSCRSREGLASQDEYKSANVLLGTEVEKFAELIVLECIRIGQETSKEIFKMSKKEGDIFEYESHGAEQVVDNIKEHFGVEE